MLPCSLAAGRAGVSVAEPPLNTRLAEHMSAWTLNRLVQHTLADAANKVWVRWGIKLLNIVPRHHGIIAHTIKTNLSVACKNIEGNP